MTPHSSIDPIEATVKALDALLTSIEHPPSSAAVIAFKAAITRHGRNLLAAAGPEALAAVIARIRADASDKAAAEDREAIVRKAWKELMQERAA